MRPGFFRIGLLRPGFLDAGFGATASMRARRVPRPSHPQSALIDGRPDNRPDGGSDGGSHGGSHGGSDGRPPGPAAAGALAGGIMPDAIAGEPNGRRVLFLHRGAGAWWRLLHAVPVGQEWLTAEVVPTMAAARLRPLLSVRGGRKAVVVAGIGSLALAVRLAVDCADSVGGLMVVEDEGGPTAWQRRVAGWLGQTADQPLPVADGDLQAIRVPVTLVRGTDSTNQAMELLERGLTGCRTLTVVEVSGARGVRPRTHPAELRAALTALVNAVERGAMERGGNERGPLERRAR
ncbi:hypothetical protein [Azospirillum thermophilum]|uniref:Alpha/beta hydrolase n=1 Tax=Azospirillum thermophilum TaxID=2202148 RepID=A0A2S2CSU2_9PROT|nr:hypothetical protein [Azospirillum thermophilum]AWK87538.1 hypothetical protein DEW08_16105 [Azospirillum thermophilum]